MTTTTYFAAPISADDRYRVSYRRLRREMVATAAMAGHRSLAIDAIVELERLGQRLAFTPAQWVAGLDQAADAIYAALDA